MNAMTRRAGGVGAGLCAALLLLLLPAHGRAAAGDLDPSFGHRGYAPVPELDSSAAVATFGDGTTAVGGINAGGRATLVALDDSGAIDKGFGTQGLLRLEPPLASENILQMTLDANDRLLVLTADETDSHLIRITSDGAADPSFGEDGVVGSDAPLTAFALDAQQRIVATAKDSIARMDADGSPDPSWGTGGTVAFDFYVYASVPDGEDRVLVAAYVNNRQRFFRLNADGLYDPAFPVLDLDRRVSVKRMAADGSDGAWVITRGCYGRGCYNSFAHVLADGSFGDDGFGNQFYPRGPLLATAGDAVVTGGGLPQAGARYSRRTTSFVRGVASGGDDPSFGLAGRAYLYPRGQSVFASGLTIDGEGREVITTTPFGGFGDAVLVARLLAGGAEENVDGDPLVDTEDRCVAIPGSRAKRGCTLLGERRVTFGTHIGLPHGRVIGVCDLSVRVRVQRIGNHRPPRTVVWRDTDYKGERTLKRRLMPGRFRVTVKKSYNHGAGICPAAKSNTVTVHKPAHSGLRTN